MDLLTSLWHKHRARARSGGGATAVSRSLETNGEHAVRPHDVVPDHRWIGYIDRVEGSVAKGWCCDLSRPNESVCVEVLASSGKRQVVSASLHREDVEAAGFGNGSHGFEIDLRRLLADGETATIRFLDSKVQIGKEPLSLDPHHGLLTHPLPPAFLGMMRELVGELRLKHAEMQAALQPHGRAGVPSASATARRNEPAKRAAR